MARITLVPQRKEFFDRYNMYRLAGALDDICDHIDEAAGNIVGYGVTEIHPAARAQGDVILRAATKLQEAVARLDGFKDSSRQLMELRELEDEGDRLNREAVSELFLTWWFGLPSSSSHALIGGLVGAALVQSGSKGVLWHGIAHKVVIPALAAPAIAFGAAFLLLLLIYWLFVWLSPGVASRGFRLGQLGTGTWVAFTHGANDAQKTMGVIALAHVVSGAVMGAGATKRLSAVRWGVAGNIVAAWILTLPAAALVAAGCYWPVQGLF